MTIREITSLILNRLKSISPDTFISKRLVYNKLVSTTKDFIKKSDIKKIYRDSSAFTTINCLEMEKVPLHTCCNISIPNCETVQKSKYKLPEMYISSLGEIMNLYTGDDDTYVKTNPKAYKKLLNLEFQGTTKYYWIEDGYIIIPNSKTKKVKVSAMFISRSKALSLDSCKSSTDRNCVEILDDPFICPAYLEDSVINTTMQLLLASANIPDDENPNLNNNLK